MGALGHAELRERSADAGRTHRTLGIAGAISQRAGGGDGLNDPSAARDQVLERVGDRAEAQVLVTTGPSELTRFANSFIHQNVGEMHSEVALMISALVHVLAVHMY